MPTPFIDSLIAASELSLYHDYRSGPLTGLDDLSGQGNDGVGTDIDWIDNTAGMRFNVPATSVITVADAAELQLTTGTLIAFGEFNSQTANEMLIHKRDAGGTNYSFYMDATTLRFFDGAATRFVAATVPGSHYLAINFLSGAVPEAFVDGLSVGVLSGVSTVTADNAPLLIGNFHTGVFNMKSIVGGVLIVNRELTATEHAVLYQELADLTWKAW